MTQPATQPSDGEMGMGPVDVRAKPAKPMGGGNSMEPTDPMDPMDPMSQTLSGPAAEFKTIIVQEVQAGGWTIGTNSTEDLDAQLMVAAKRMGEKPNKKQMQRAKANARKLGKALVAEAEGTNAPQITRTLMAETVSKLSPLWPFTDEEVPPVVPVAPGEPIDPAG